MPLAISNIAWTTADEPRILELLGELGIRGIEVAPTKLFAQPLQASSAQIAAVRKSYEQRGLTIVAAQALLFGQSDLQIFTTPQSRTATLEYLGGIIRVCSELGAGALVFGSPKNRQVGTRPAAEVAPIARDFFGQLAETAQRHGTRVVMEANPAAYGCDFVTHAREALELVLAVNHPGLGLHMDSGCMTMTGEGPEVILSRGAGLVGHYHISEPMLGPIGKGGVAHGLFAAALKNAGYTGWVSVEMKTPEGSVTEVVKAALEYAKGCYE